MKNIYLTGFMGSGKSTTGRLISKMLRVDFVDTDDLISGKYGIPVNEIFLAHGEESFRNAETSVLKKLSRKNNLVVATGGGVCERPENLQIMNESGTAFFLDAGLDEIASRLGTCEIDRRPLWQDAAQVEDLYKKRHNNYLSYGQRIDVDGQAVLSVANSICASVSPEKDYTVNYEGHPGQVKAVWNGPSYVMKYAGGRRAVVLTDRTVERLHLDRYLEVLNNPPVISLKPGEKSKTLKTAGFIYDKLLDAKIGRGDLLIAIGGGVITDIGGFVASTYKRGIDFILVGTTLVAGVDAAIGGKSAIDHANVKNSVGLFTKPLVTILDIASLSTLARKQVSEGLIEAYKTGLVSNPDLCSYMEDNVRRLMSGSVIELAEAMKASAGAKCKVVTEDFREKNVRRILNFGHTYGHAVESFNNYTISHGASVAQGMLVAIAISLARRFIDDETSGRASRLIKKMAPSPVNLPSAAQAWQIMLNDKKNTNGKIAFVLLHGLGKCEVVDNVTPEELDSAINHIRKNGNE